MKGLQFAAVAVILAFGAVGFAVEGIGGALAAGLVGGLLLRLLLSVRSPVDGPARVTPRAGEEMRFLGRLFLAAFAVRAVLSIALHVTGWWAYMGGDEQTYDYNGQAFAAWVDKESPWILSSRYANSHEVGYFYLVGSLYYAYGVSKLLPLVLNALIGAAILYPVYGLAARFGGRVAARRAAVLIAFFPSLMLWSSLLVRDTLVLFFLALTLLAVERLRRRFRFSHLLALVACLGLLSTLRTYMFLLVAVSLAAALLLGRRSIVQSLWIGGLVMAALVLTVRGTGLGQSELDRANLEHLSTMRKYNAYGAWGVDPTGSLGADADISTPTAALTYLPIGMIHWFFSPLLWMAGSLRQAMAIPELVLWYSLFPAILTGTAWLVRHRFRAALPLLLTVAGISILYSLVEGNMGIIFRHRAQVIVPLCAVAGVGYALKKRRARKEAARVARAVPLDPAAGGPLGPAPGLRLPSRA